MDGREIRKVNRIISRQAQKHKRKREKQSTFFRPLAFFVVSLDLVVPFRDCIILEDGRQPLDFRLLPLWVCEKEKCEKQKNRKDNISE
jgi:hypothetical protein